MLSGILPVPPQSERGRMWLRYSQEEWSVNSATAAIPYTYHSGLGAIQGGHAVENRLLPFSGRPVVDVIKAGLNSKLHGASVHTGKLCRRESIVSLGTATAISPTHILVARHCLNQLRLSDLNFRIDGLEREMRLVEDGSSHGYDYAVLEVVAHSFKSFVRLEPVQPPVSGFAGGYSPDNRLILHAEDKPLSNSFFLQEVNYLPINNGMSGAIYRDTQSGTGFAVHIKRCVGGLFEGQNTGILVAELNLGLPATSALKRIIAGDYNVSAISMPDRFSHFSTARADEIDQGVTQLRALFQAQIKANGCFLTPSMKVGCCAYSDAAIATPDRSKFFKTIDRHSNVTAIPLIIEIMETNSDCARAKIDALVGSGRLTRNPIAVIVGLNKKVDDLNKCNDTFDRLIASSTSLAAHMQARGIRGACIPMVWKKVTPGEGYVFPYLEARSLLNLHPGIQIIHDQFLDLATPPVFRWMDSDVFDDPLLLPCASDADKVREKRLQTALYGIAQNANVIGSGGYRWQTTQIKDRLWALGLISVGDDGMVCIMTRVVETINDFEAKVRIALLETLGHRGIYWPEPNLYSSFDIRQEGAVRAYEWVDSNRTKSQQQESKYLVRSGAITDGVFDPVLATTKPIKATYAEWDTFFIRMVPLIRARTTDREAVKAAVMMTRQTHLNTNNVVSIHGWHEKFFDKDCWADVCEQWLSECAVEIFRLIKLP